VILKRIDGRWFLTDEGHTLMHMEYSGVDFRSPTRWKVVEHALASHQVKHDAGELDDVPSPVESCDGGLRGV
jgi:hypothetical protein